MSTPVCLFRKTLNASKDGLFIATERWYVVKETHHFYHIISEATREKLDGKIESGCDLYRLATRLHLGDVKRTKKEIQPNARRFAFHTEQDAFDFLVNTKRKQLAIAQRNLAFCMAFLDGVKKGQVDAASAEIPGTAELVNYFYNFDQQ